jgi:hypothetical protein
MSTVHGPIRQDVTQVATPKPVVEVIPSASPVKVLPSNVPPKQ